MYIATSRKRGGTPHPQQATQPHTEINEPESLENEPDTLSEDNDSAGSKTTTAGAPAVAKLMQPNFIFLLLSALFWSCWIASYSGYQKQPSANSLGLPLHSIPCNPSGRMLAICAHRANAAELLLKNKTLSAIKVSGLQELRWPVLKQMTELWQLRIRCFDLDVVQLSGGKMIAGHPADLVQHARAFSSSSSSSQAGNLVAGLLHEHTLSELRAAGVDDSAAPLLQTVFHHFAQLMGKDREMRSTPAAAAATGRDSWRHTPALSIELKGPAAASLQAWKQMINLAYASGISANVILMVRQPTSSSRSALLQLAAGIKQECTKAASTQKDTRLATIPGPLLGLIVPDTLLQQQQLRHQRPQMSPNSTAAAHMLLLQAAGTAASSLANTGTGDTAAATAGKAGNSGAGNSTAAVVLEMFDLLAPSIKLPPTVLAELTRMKPVMAWTMESDEDIYKAMWLGLDLCSSSKPVAHHWHAEATQKEVNGFCGRSSRP